MRLLSPAELAARIGSNLDLLRTGDADRPERQRTLRATIAWSFDLLEPAQQDVFRQFSVFAGGCDLEALEAVCVVPDTVDLLSEVENLVLHSLIRSVSTPVTTRFAMLATIQAFAREQARANGEDEELRGRHYGHYAALAVRGAPELLKVDRGVWLTRLSADIENLRAAMAWAIEMSRGTDACLLVGHLWRYWHMRGDLAEGRRWTEAALAISGSDPRPRMSALEAAGGLAYWAADTESARFFYSEATEIARHHGDEGDVANALYNMSFALAFGGDWDQGHRAIDEALATYRELGQLDGVARVLWARGTLASIERRLEPARRDFEEALGLYAQLDDQFQLGWTHRMLARTVLDLGQVEVARAHLVRGMEIFSRDNDTSGIVLMLRDVAQLAILEGDDDVAMVLAGAYQSLQEKTGLDLVEVHNEIPELADTRTRLGQERTTELWAQGAALTTDEALAVARARLGVGGETQPGGS